jgi:NADH-quinone oxidoreductase subunit M
MYPVLTVSTFLPLVGAAVILLMPERLARWIALATTLATLIVSAPLYLDFDKTSSALQFAESRPWIPSWNVSSGMGVDGISLPFVFLSIVVSVLCVAVSWNAIQTRQRGFYAALLGAETAMVGLFAATNLFLFYVFWELMLVPMFFLIGVWGSGGRVYAAFKFLLFTLAGSVLMLVALIVLL